MDALGRFCLAALCMVSLSLGCVPLNGVAPNAKGSLGTVSSGMLGAASRLPERGEHFRVYRRGNRIWAVRPLVDLVEHAASEVAEKAAGSVLRVGDLSAKRGGRISGHRSHRSGRDVDLAFYVIDSEGRPLSGVPLVHFDRFGIGIRQSSPVFFDPRRNWLLVEALLTYEGAKVQWIFTSHGVKALLLEWALAHDRDIEIVQRASIVLHQPSDSAYHDDHFHVRIYCPREPEVTHCVDTGPIWPWIRPTFEEHPHWSSDELASLALDGLSIEPDLLEVGH